MKVLIYAQEEKNTTKHAIYIRVTYIFTNWRSHRWNILQHTFSVTDFSNQEWFSLSYWRIFHQQKLLVCIATCCGLDGPGIESQLGWDFPHQSSSVPGSNSASYTMGEDYFPGVERPGFMVEHTTTCSAEVKERVELYLYFTSWCSWPVIGWNLNTAAVTSDHNPHCTLIHFIRQQEVRRCQVIALCDESSLVLSQLILYTGQRPTAAHYPHVAMTLRVSGVSVSNIIYIYIYIYISPAMSYRLMKHFM